MTQELMALTAEQLWHNAIRRRAVEAVVWGMPAENFDLMRQALFEAMKGADNQVPHWRATTLWTGRVDSTIHPRGLGTVRPCQRSD
jgi:hypothetical protein